MTRGELIEKVARKLQLIAGDEYDYDVYGLDKYEASKYASELLDTIFAALKELTEGFNPENVSYHRGMSRLDWWRAMLAASPLAPEGGRK